MTRPELFAAFEQDCALSCRWQQALSALLTQGGPVMEGLT
jgi:hypothetical protein